MDFIFFDGPYGYHQSRSILSPGGFDPPLPFGGGNEKNNELTYVSKKSLSVVSVLLRKPFKNETDETDETDSQGKCWYPSCLSPPTSPLEGVIPNRYPLTKRCIWG